MSRYQQPPLRVSILDLHRNAKALNLQKAILKARLAAKRASRGAK